MTQAIQAALQLLLAMLPKLKIDSAIITTAIEALIEWLPYIQQGGQQLIDDVDQIISILSSSDDVTAEQLQMMKALQQQSDTDYDNALAAYRAAHPKGA